MSEESAFKKTQEIKKGLSKEARVYYGILSHFWNQSVDASDMSANPEAYMEALEAFSEVLSESIHLTRILLEMRKGGSNE